MVILVPDEGGGERGEGRGERGEGTYLALDRCKFVCFLRILDNTSALVKLLDDDSLPYH